MALLTAKDLLLGYDGRAVAERLNFSVAEGDYLFILGGNGSGKTTLMKTILHLAAPLGGSIETGDGLRRSEIGYLPQQTEVQRDFPASVFEIVLSGCLGRSGKRPFYSAADKAMARENLEKMGITALAKRCYRELSGGQQQRVLLARALCATSKLLLLDEPATGLDPVASSEMYELIASLNRDGLTVMMISHDIDAAVKYATNVLQIGKEIFFGTRDEYVQSGAGGLLRDFGKGERQ